MAEGEKLKKFSTWADSWWKIITIGIAIIIFIYNVSVIRVTIDENKKELEILKEKINQELQIRDDKDDKRYKQIIDIFNELKNHGMELKKDVEQIKVDVAYEKGKSDVFHIK
jgi:hypothetical protein